MPGQPRLQSLSSAADRVDLRGCRRELARIDRCEGISAARCTFQSEGCHSSKSASGLPRQDPSTERTPNEHQPHRPELPGEPNYPKMPGEPKRVQPSKDRDLR